MKARRSRLTYTDGDTIALLLAMIYTSCYGIVQVDETVLKRIKIILLLYIIIIIMRREEKRIRRQFQIVRKIITQK
jgi:hypothetical protein